MDRRRVNEGRCEGGKVKTRTAECASTHATGAWPHNLAPRQLLLTRRQLEHFRFYEQLE